MKLRLQNVGQATITVKDLQGYSSFVAEAAGGETVDTEITQDVLQRIAPSLRDLENNVMKDDLGNILVGLRWSVMANGDADDRALTEGLAGLPTVLEYQDTDYSTGTPVADSVATGTALLGNQVKASAQLLHGTARLDLEAVAPGAPGNSVSCEIITPSSTLLVSVAGNKISVRPAAGGSTVTDIATAINAHATAKYMVQATEGVAGTIDAAVAETFLAGGIGPGVSLTLGGTACPITALTATQVTFDPPGGISAAGRIVALDYRCGPHLSRLSIPVIA